MDIIVMIVDGCYLVDGDVLSPYFVREFQVPKP